MVEPAALAMAVHMAGVWATKTFTKGKLLLLPVGMLQAVKEVKDTMVLMSFQQVKFQIAPPKLDLKAKEGMLVPYFHIKLTGDRSKAITKSGDTTVPCWKNVQKVEPGDQLLYWKDPNQDDQVAEATASAKKPRNN